MMSAKPWALGAECWVSGLQLLLARMLYEKLPFSNDFLARFLHESLRCNHPAHTISGRARLLLFDTLARRNGTPAPCRSSLRLALSHARSEKFAASAHE